MKSKVGIMGGTFDPIHIGHLILAENAYEQFGLSKVVFMPSGNPPHKRARHGCASNEQRTEMVELAIRDNPHFAISLKEMTEEGFSYSYRTFEELKAEHPDTDYYFIMGADSLMDFDDWKEPQRIIDACIPVVATRNHLSEDVLNAQIAHIKETYHANILKLDTLNIDISSMQIRLLVTEGHTIRYYVPDAVMEYIEKNGVYDARKENCVWQKNMT